MTSHLEPSLLFLPSRLCSSPALEVQGPPASCAPAAGTLDLLGAAGCHPGKMARRNRHRLLLLLLRYLVVALGCKLLGFLYPSCLDQPAPTLQPPTGRSRKVSGRLWAEVAAGRLTLRPSERETQGARGRTLGAREREVVGFL